MKEVCLSREGICVCVWSHDMKEVCLSREGIRVWVGAVTLYVCEQL